MPGMPKAPKGAHLNPGYEMVPGTQVTSGMPTAGAIANPTPGVSGGVDQDAYEQKGNDWIKSTCEPPPLASLP